jgi:polyhydroxyalkanoate synthesis regulator phasin
MKDEMSRNKIMTLEKEIEELKEEIEDLEDKVK